MQGTETQIRTNNRISHQCFLQTRRVTVVLLLLMLIQEQVSLPELYFIKFFLDECVSSMKLYAAMTLTSLKRRAAAEVATVDFTLLKPQLGYKSS